VKDSRGISLAPRTSKAREVAVEVENFELHFIDHSSFIDTTVIQGIPTNDILMACPMGIAERGSSSLRFNGVLRTQHDLMVR
jgi:hypothetical protein